MHQSRSVSLNEKKSTYIRHHWWQFFYYKKSSWFYSNILLLYAIFQSYQWHHLTGITELVLIFFTNEYKNDHDKKVTSVLRSDRKLFGGKFMH